MGSDDDMMRCPRRGGAGPGSQCWSADVSMIPLLESDARRHVRARKSSANARIGDRASSGSVLYLAHPHVMFPP